MPAKYLRILLKCYFSKEVLTKEEREELQSYTHRISGREFEYYFMLNEIFFEHAYHPYN